MKVGIRIFGQHPNDVSPDENFRTCLDQVRAARSANFDLIWCGHHYATERWQKFQVVPALGRFAAEAGDMHIGTAFLLPLHHPLIIAEQFATLDAMTGGKVILAPVAGYRDIEFESLGISKAERAGRLIEGVEAIKRLWTEDNVTFDGKYFSFRNVTITPKPVQNPHPPIWIGANTDAAVKRASTLGDAWLANPHSNNETLARQIQLITPPTGEGFHGVQPGRREVFVAETDDDALNIFGRALSEYYDWYDDVGQGEVMDRPDELAMAFEKLKEDRFIIGSPETVATHLVDLNDRVGIDCVIMAPQTPSLAHDDVLRCIELIGREVMPMVNDRV